MQPAAVTCHASCEIRLQVGVEWVRCLSTKQQAWVAWVPLGLWRPINELTTRGGSLHVALVSPVNMSRAVVRLPDPKLKTLGERGIECIFGGYVEHSKAFNVIEPNESISINSIIESKDVIFNENRFSSVSRPSLRIPNGTEDIGGFVVPEENTEEVVQQPEPGLEKAKGIGHQRTLDLNFNYT
ncbi:hypothetical protein Tco_1354225 [Tanacetum coccineum]